MPVYPPIVSVPEEEIVQINGWNNGNAGPFVNGSKVYCLMRTIGPGTSGPPQDEVSLSGQESQITMMKSEDVGATWVRLDGPTNEVGLYSFGEGHFNTSAYVKDGIFYVCYTNNLAGPYTQFAAPLRLVGFDTFAETWTAESSDGPWVRQAQNNSRRTVSHFPIPIAGNKVIVLFTANDDSPPDNDHGTSFRGSAYYTIYDIDADTWTSKTLVRAGTFDGTTVGISVFPVAGEYDGTDTHVICVQWDTATDEQRFYHHKVAVDGTVSGGTLVFTQSSALGSSVPLEAGRLLIMDGYLALSFVISNTSGVMNAGLVISDSLTPTTWTVQDSGQATYLLNGESCMSTNAFKHGTDIRLYYKDTTYPGYIGALSRMVWNGTTWSGPTMVMDRDDDWTGLDANDVNMSEIGDTDVAVAMASDWPFYYGVVGPVIEPPPTTTGKPMNIMTYHV